MGSIKLKKIIRYFNSSTHQQISSSTRLLVNSSTFKKNIPPRLLVYLSTRQLFKKTYLLVNSSTCQLVNLKKKTTGPTLSKRVSPVKLFMVRDISRNYIPAACASQS